MSTYSVSDTISVDGSRGNGHDQGFPVSATDLRPRRAGLDADLDAHGIGHAPIFDENRYENEVRTS